MPHVALVITPDEDDDDFAEVAVDGTVAGRPHRFVLDTGAWRTHVAGEAVATLGGVGRHRSAGLFGAADTDLVEVPVLEVGPIRCGPLLVSRSTTGPSLLGMDVLGRHRCHFRFRKARLELGPSEHAADLPLHLDERSHPYVDVRLPGGTGHAVWDSGAGVTVVDQGLVARRPQAFAPRGASWGTDSTGARQQTRMLLMAGAVVGGVPLAPHVVAVVDLSEANAALTRPMDLVLGWTTLRQADWLLDFPARRWAVTRVHAEG